MAAPTTSSASAGPALVHRDYTDSPYNYISLDTKGNLIERIIITIDTSYRVLKIAKNAMQSAAFTAMALFESLGCPCSRRYEMRQQRHVIELNGVNYPQQLKRIVNDLCRSNPGNFQYSIVSTVASVITPPDRPSDELVGKIQKIANGAYGLNSTEAEIRALLIARSQATRVQNKPGYNPSILCVSSKSPLFSEINTALRIENYLNAGSGSPPDWPHYTLASVRVLPDGSSSLSLPRCPKFKGGIKIVPGEIYLSPKENIVLAMRRTKLLKAAREKKNSDRIAKSTHRVHGLSSPYLATPAILFYHPKHGIQTLTTHCKQGLKSLFEAYLNVTANEYSETNPEISAVLTTPIETQVITLLDYILHIVKALQYLNENNLCHNDVKPGNIMIDEGTAKLIDFDFTCTSEEGLLGHDGGTLDFMIGGYKKKNLRSEFYALACTICLRKPELFYSRGSFALAFNCLHRLAYKRDKKDQAQKVWQLINQIYELHNLLVIGTSPGARYSPPSFGEIISRIEDMKTPFNSVAWRKTLRKI